MSYNPLSKFLSLLPAKPRSIGIIQTVVGEDRYIIECLGGGTLMVNGTGGLIVGDTVILKDGVIETKGVSLTPTILEV